MKTLLPLKIPYQPGYIIYVNMRATVSFTPLNGAMKKNDVYKGDTLNAKRRAYLLIYHNPDKAAQEESRFNQHMEDFHQELVDGTKRSYWEKDYAQYFTVNETPKRGRQVIANEEAMRQLGNYLTTLRCYITKSKILKRHLGI